MSVAIDIIVLVSLIIAVLVGLFKGFIGQLLGFVGVILVLIGVAYLHKYPAGWLESAIPTNWVRVLVACLITAIVLGAVYGLIATIIKRLVRNVKIIGVVDRILGLVFAVAIVYTVFAFLFVVMPENWFTDSWVAKNIYANNFWGNFLWEQIKKSIDGNAQALIGMLSI